MHVPVCIDISCSLISPSAPQPSPSQGKMSVPDPSLPLWQALPGHAKRAFLQLPEHAAQHLWTKVGDRYNQLHKPVGYVIAKVRASLENHRQELSAASERYDELEALPPRLQGLWPPAVASRPDQLGGGSGSGQSGAAQPALPWGESSSYSTSPGSHTSESPTGLPPQRQQPAGASHAHAPLVDLTGDPSATAGLRLATGQPQGVPSPHLASAGPAQGSPIIRPSVAGAASPVQGPRLSQAHGSSDRSRSPPRVAPTRFHTTQDGTVHTCQIGERVHRRMFCPLCAGPTTAHGEAGSQAVALQCPCGAMWCIDVSWDMLPDGVAVPRFPHMAIVNAIGNGWA